MAPLVPEVSRDYLNHKIDRQGHFQYSEPDLLEIASQQFSGEKNTLAKNPDLVICDTDLLVLIVWSEVRFGQCHQWILDTFADSIAAGNRHYLLCDFNIPWQPDPLREHADSRGELFELYRQKLEFYNLTYSIVAGGKDERLASAMALISGKTMMH